MNTFRLSGTAGEIVRQTKELINLYGNITLTELFNLIERKKVII